MSHRSSLTAALLLAACLGCTPGVPVRPNIALIVLDTVRADRITCGGGGSAATPKFDALCERGIRFTQASSTSGWTLPAHASLFTGLYPIQHGATQEHTRLDGGAATLAELLAAEGYRTLGVSANPLVSVKSGLARGFAEFVETWHVPLRTAHPAAQDHPNFLAVERLLADLQPAEPFFLFVNYIEAHGPNDPPEPHRSRALAPGVSTERIERARHRGAKQFYLDPAAISAAEFELLADLYDAEVAYLDELVGGLIQALEAAGHLDDTIVILTSDHGENFGDHGHFRHVFSLYGSSVRVPLLILLPGGARAGEVRSEPVALVDLFTTLLAAAGIAPDELPGRDLLGDLAADAAPPIIAEYYYPMQALGLFPPDAVETHRRELGPHLRRLRSIETEGLRLIWSSDGRHELFDLVGDPDEQTNLHGQSRFAERESELLGRLAAFVKSAGGPRPLPNAAQRPGELEGAFEDLDPASAELLRELGYLPR